MPDRLLIVTVTPAADAALDEAKVAQAVREFGEALGEALTSDQPVIASVTFGWEPALPPPGSVLAALVTVLIDRGRDPAVIAKRIGRVDEDELVAAVPGSGRRPAGVPARAAQKQRRPAGFR